VFSTHILEEVDAACTRAIIIDRGRIVANGTPEELRGMSELAGAVTLSARGATEENSPALGRVERLDGAFRIYPRDKVRAAELRRASSSWSTGRAEGGRDVQRGGGARRGVPPHHPARPRSSDEADPYHRQARAGQLFHLAVPTCSW